MRSPLLTKRVLGGDAESELNLPPGFRFHPTDEELIVHYLIRKSQSTLDVASHRSIIAEVDIYKHEPWELPEMALFGTKEWYFFTPRDRKYPNGSRPNRVTGNGYWKATGADKRITSKSDKNTTTVGIKKALVFYAGKGLTGIKTNWIMHEYRLAASKLDEWVLCRLYNKKNNPKEMIMVPHDEDNNNNNIIHQTTPLQKQHSPGVDMSFDSLESSEGEFGGSFEGDVMFSGDLQPESLSKVEDIASEESSKGLMIMKKEDVVVVDDGIDWLDGLSLEDLHHCLEASASDDHDFYELTPMIYNNVSNQQYFFS